MGDSTRKPARQIDWGAWVPEIHATLIFVVRDEKILLIEKLRGIGKGKVNGPGGKIDPGENALQAAIREAEEELRIRVTNAEKRGELWFAMSDIPDIHCHVFQASEFTGTPTATDEAIPRWTALNEIPFDLMWADDRHWLPKMLEGRLFDARFRFEGESILEHDLIFDDPSGWRGDPRPEEITIQP